MGHEAAGKPRAHQGDAEEPELKRDAGAPYPGWRPCKHQPMHVVGFGQRKCDREESPYGVRHDIDLAQREGVENLTQEDPRDLQQIDVIVLERVGESVAREIHGDHVPMSGKLLQDRCPGERHPERAVDQQPADGRLRAPSLGSHRATSALAVTWLRARSAGGESPALPPPADPAHCPYGCSPLIADDLN